MDSVAPPGAQRFKPAEERMETIDQATPGFLPFPFQYRTEYRGFWSLASILSTIDTIRSGDQKYEEVKSWDLYFLLQSGQIYQLE